MTIKNPQIQYYSFSFQDVDLLRESVLKWNLEVFPLEVAELKYNITQALTPQFLIGEGNFSCKTEQRGATPPGFRTFVIPANDAVNYCWRGRNLNGNHLSLFPLNGELHSVSNQTFHVFTVSFHHNLVDNACKTLGSIKLEEAIKTENVWRINGSTMQKMRVFAAAIIRQLAHGESITRLQQELLLEILLAVRNSEEARPKVELIQKHNMLKRATDWMRLHVIEPQPLSKFYNEMGMSERAIQTAFKDQFGLTLKSYYKNYRLSKVRHALKLADSRSVSEIAAHYGYWHMGQFSKDYKKLFGELPTHTLKRCDI